MVTPLAVLINWTNEIKKFTPGLTFIKVHGSVQERDRILSVEDVISGAYDVYLTTYETMMSEEAFFSEELLRGLSVGGGQAQGVSSLVISLVPVYNLRY